MSVLIEDGVYPKSPKTSLLAQVLLPAIALMRRVVDVSLKPLKF